MNDKKVRDEIQESSADEVRVCCLGPLLFTRRRCCRPDVSARLGARITTTTIVR